MASRPKVTRTVQITDGSWYQLSDYTQDVCCDCGETDDVSYRLSEEGALVETSTRNARQSRKNAATSGKVVRNA